MIKAIIRASFFILLALIIQCRNPIIEDNITFYDVPLVCGAAPEIGCGSRIKPLFIDVEKQSSIKEAWTNRQGTIIGIVWNGSEDEKLIQSLFAKNKIEAQLIYDDKKMKSILKDFGKSGSWLRGLEVDQLSLEEAGIIAVNLTQFAENNNLITREECLKIRKDLEEYFKRELVIVRTEDELRSAETQDRWLRDGYEIYKKHIGMERANAVSEFYFNNEGSFMQDESCCSKNESDDCCRTKSTGSLKSEITCPNCGFKKTETLPEDVCVIKYACSNCNSELTPLAEDCCVFCSYGTHKCPSKQEA